MNLKVIAIFSVFVATSAFAQGQIGGPTPQGPKPTIADVQKVIKIISGDQAKAKLYCDLAKLSDQAADAEENDDTKKVEDLNKQIDASVPKLGIEYMNFVERLQQIDLASEENQDLAIALQSFDKLCSKD